MLLLACTAPERAVVVAEPDERLVELVLDRGRFADGEWVSEPVGDDALVEPAAAVQRGEGTLARAWATLPFGDGVARVRRECGIAEVPYRVGAEQTVLLPYPACEARSDAIVTWGEVARLHALGLFAEVPDPGPGEDDLPARWITLAEARAYCAWTGGRLPSEAPPGPIEVWLADGRIAGAAVRDVPDNARAETIGLRCTY
ncbi:MAG: hypothetical protein ACOZNI_31230 [Myxococcota bacterium]